MRAQVRLGSRLCWAAAWLLALTGVALYLVSPDGRTWLVGIGLLVPLIGLIVWRQERAGYADEGGGVVDAGPWMPPPGP